MNKSVASTTCSTALLTSRFPSWRSAAVLCPSSTPGSTRRCHMHMSPDCKADLRLSLAGATCSSSQSNAYGTSRGAYRWSKDPDPRIPATPLQTLRHIEQTRSCCDRTRGRVPNFQASLRAGQPAELVRTAPHACPSTRLAGSAVFYQFINSLVMYASICQG